MIIQCEECRTKFNMDEAFLKNEGTKVKCSRCKHVFVAFPPEQVEAEYPQTLGVSEEDLGALEELTDAGLEEADFDDVFEDESMEDIEDLEAKYREDSRGVAEKEDMDRDSVKDSDDEAEDDSADDTGPVRPVSEKKKSGKTHTLLILCVIILVLLGIAYAVTKWVPELVPDSWTLLKTKPAGKQQSTDMGANRLEILTVSGSFVDSDKTGRLFVIRGKVRNSYRASRSFILVKGDILDAKGQVVKEKSVYAGNAFEEEALLTLPLEEINKAMKNRQGSDKKNLNVKPGKTVDFEIVFDNLPENLSEFTVGALSSSPGSPD